MKEIRMVPVNELEGFDPTEFVVYPARKFETVYPDQDLMEKAKLAAQSVPAVCICIVRDDLGVYALGESCCKGCSQRYILFNAAETSRQYADMRAVTWNTGRGALTRYWFDRWIRYQPGSVV